LNKDLDDSCPKRKKYESNGADTPVNVTIVEEIKSCHNISYHVCCLKEKFEKEET
jgi:hypothetical protein